MGRITAAVAVWLGASASGWGCYTPTPAEGDPCSETGKCPTGLVCDPGSLTCVEELPSAATFASIDVGSDHTCALDAAGGLWCWGASGSGQVGNGRVDALVPVHVTGGMPWSEVSAGHDATCGIRTDQTLWCWGAGIVTGLGDQLEPMEVTEPAAAWAHVTVGIGGYCALTTGGELYCRWDPDPLPVPASVTGILAPIVSIHASGTHHCVLDQDQHLYCWGEGNTRGQVGNGTTDPVLDPVAILPGRTWKSVAVAEDVTCAIASDDTLWCWGECNNNQAGTTDGSGVCPTPAQVGTDHYLAVDPGDDHTCAVRADGAMVCFGTNEAGQLGGLGGDTQDHGPIIMFGIGEFETVSSGLRHSCGLRHGGEAWCWGRNTFGELGDGTGGGLYEPVKIVDGDWTSLALADNTSCGVQADHTLWCWGKNAHGELGDGTQFQRHRPVQVGTDTNWSAVTTGDEHACAIRTDGTLWCWGSNRNNQLGTRTIGQLAPYQVGTDTTWTSIAAAAQSTCGIRGGRLYCWGGAFSDSPSEIDPGPGWTTVAASPYGNGVSGLPMCGLRAGDLYCWNNDIIGAPADATVHDWESFAIGWDHGCGLTTGGVARCIGENNVGQIGQDVIGGNYYPSQPVVGGTAWTMIDAGDGTSCGISGAAALYCWGEAYLNGLGEGADDVGAPTQILRGTQWRTVDVGYGHACAAQIDGSLWCWGTSDFGERGDGGGGTDRAVRVKPPM